MANAQYEIIEGTYQLEENSHKGYGIMLKDKNISLADISTDKDAILRLIDLCNALNLDPMHLEDVVEDFLVSQ